MALERKRARNKKGGKLTTDRRNRAAQAFWAMHVEALNWSGMSVREYAKALGISQFSLRRWRDLIADEELVIDWRAQLHASARPQISSGASSAANGDAAGYGLNEAPRGARRGAALNNCFKLADALGTNCVNGATEFLNTCSKPC